MSLILTRAPGPLAAKQPESVNDPAPYLTVGAFPCIHPSFDGKHADGVHGQKVPFWSHLTIAPYSSYSSNYVWQTPDALIY